MYQQHFQLFLIVPHDCWNFSIYIRIHHLQLFDNVQTIYLQTKPFNLAMYIRGDV